MKLQFLILSFLVACSSAIANSTEKDNFKPNFDKPVAVFEENKGQVKDQHWKSRPDVLFYGSQQGMQYYIRNNGLSFQLSRVDSWCDTESLSGFPERQKMKVPDQISTYRVDAQWINHNPRFSVERGKALGGYTNYYNVPEGVAPALFVQQYERVTLKNVWNGIDIHYYGTDGLLETDYLVAPGADYRQISMEIKGAELCTSPDGHLIMKTPFGEIHEGELKVFQDEERLQAFWKIETGNRVRFEIPAYNPALALRIDPVTRVWATYYGAGSQDYGRSTTTDASGNVYLAGFTESTSDISSGGHQNTFGGGLDDAYLVKFNSNGVRIWGTYFGGFGSEGGFSTSTDGSGNAFLVGTTNSSTNIAFGGHQPVYGGLYDAFLVKFDPNGVLQWSTYYGSPLSDFGRSTATDVNGNVYLAGITESTTAIASSGHQNTLGGFKDAFLVKFDSNGVRQWATYYGGNGDDQGYSAATDGSGNVYLSGRTGNSPVMASNGHQNTYGGGSFDAFLVKFNSVGIRQWGTFYGGSSAEYGNSVATDVSGNVYLAGETGSATGIASAGHQTTLSGFQDAFLVKFDSNGVRLWGTYYGGSQSEEGNSTTTSSSGNVYLAGITNSSSSIASGGFQNALGGGDDAFLAKFNGNGVRQWGTYFGGTSSENCFSVAVDAVEGAFLSGFTWSISNMAFAGHQNILGGLQDAYLAKFNDSLTTGIPPVAGTLDDLQVVLYPNPANEALNLVMGEDVFVREFRVVDEIGRVVFNQTLNRTLSAYTLATDRLANGIYTVQLITPEGQLNRKFVKLRD